MFQEEERPKLRVKFIGGREVTGTLIGRDEGAGKGTFLRFYGYFGVLEAFERALKRF